MLKILGFVYLVGMFLVAWTYRKHEFGFWGVMLACMLTTPLFGWVIINAYEFKSKWQRRDA